MDCPCCGEVRSRRSPQRRSATPAQVGTTAWPVGGREAETERRAPHCPGAAAAGGVRQGNRPRTLRALHRPTRCRPMSMPRWKRSSPASTTILNGRADAGSNQAVRMTVKQVLNDRRISPLWREFFEYHTSGEYWRDVVRLFGDRFRRAFPGSRGACGASLRGLARGAARFRRRGRHPSRLPVRDEHAGDRGRQREDRPCRPLRQDLQRAVLFPPAGDETPGGDFEIYRWRREPRFIKHRAWIATSRR